MIVFLLVAMLVSITGLVLASDTRIVEAWAVTLCVASTLLITSIFLVAIER